jgi:hypothetical protein
VKLHNNDSNASKFDLEMNTTLNRFKAMLVMSDGGANRCHPGFSCSLGASDNEVIDRACQARDEFGITVYSVAFGSAADNVLLNKTACWDCRANDWIPDCDNFFSSDNADELKEIYKLIAQDIVGISFIGQLINVSGNVSLNNTLYPDSYIEFNYTPIVTPFEYGELSLTFESKRLNESTGGSFITPDPTGTMNGTKLGWYFVPEETEIVDAKITSYSAQYWTDRLWVNSSATPNQNWTRVYWLGDYSDEYIPLGDPYLVQIPANLVGIGNNSVRIGTGFDPVNVTGGSPDDRVIYTLKIKGILLEGYSNVFPKAKGCSVNVYYDIDGDNAFDGWSYIEVGPDPTDAFDPQNDSVDDAFMRLLNSLNFMFDVNPGNYGNGSVGNEYDGVNQSNPIDLQITTQISFDSASVSGVPSLWGPARLEIRIWM